MTFRNWLYESLVKEHIIDSDDFDVDDYTADDILQCTELDEEDLLNYKAQYEEGCRLEGSVPEFDLDDMPA